MIFIKKQDFTCLGINNKYRNGEIFNINLLMIFQKFEITRNKSSAMSWKKCIYLILHTRFKT